MELQKCEAVLPSGTLTGKFQPFKVEQQLLSKVPKNAQNHRCVIHHIKLCIIDLSTSIQNWHAAVFFCTCARQSQPVHRYDSSLFAQKACRICCIVHLITSPIGNFLTLSCSQIIISVDDVPWNLWIILVLMSIDNKTSRRSNFRDGL